MPIHIEDMISDITVVDGDLPLSARQLEALSTLVTARVLEKQRDADRYRDAVQVRRSVLPPPGTRG